MDQASHLLLINSDLEDRTCLRELLDPLAVKVTEVTSGLAAVDVLQRIKIDLVVTELSIGSFDSWRLARIIRSGVYQGGRTIPIIVITRNWCERITEITARDFEINYLLPFDGRQLLPEMVQRCLKAPADGFCNRSLLVIEDHSDNARLIRKILQARFNVDIAPDGTAGLASWHVKRHDLVLLDIMLPGMSGSTVLEKILEVNPLQPVVVMTAHGSIDLATKLMVKGAADFISKPFRAEELRRVCDLAARREDYLVSNAQFAARLSTLQKLRNLLGNIIDSMPSVLIEVDRNGIVNLWNQGAEKVSGIPAADAQGQPLAMIWSDFTDMEEVQLALQKGEIRKLTNVPRHKDGMLCYCDLTVYPLCEKEIVGAVIRMDDVTERVMLEEHIIQSEKMVSMGQMAAGMAHEINNPLAGVMQNIQVIRNRLSGSSNANLVAAEAAAINMDSLADYLSRRDVPARLDAVMESGGRAAQLIENMLDFSRREPSAMLANDLAALLDKSIELAASNFSLKRKFDFRLIEIQRDYPGNLPLVECNPSQLQQVFLNLLMNGAHAMENKLQEIRNSVDKVDYSPLFTLRIRQEEQDVVVEIEDNGPGMNDETRRQVFEPFFTTKKIGEGTGLGLSICYFIIAENHRGSLIVDPTLDAGARFTIRIPIKKK